MSRDVTQLSENFYRWEFACRCGCGLQTVDAELVQIWQRIRTHYGRRVHITSGARCKQHNTDSNGYPNSKHLRGEAADGAVEGIPAQEVQALLRRWYPDRYGLGRARNYTHLDVRPARADWHY